MALATVLLRSPLVHTFALKRGRITCCRVFESCLLSLAIALVLAVVVFLWIDLIGGACVGVFPWFSSFFFWVLFRFYLGVVAFCLRSLSPGLIGLMVRLSACTAGRVCQTQQPGSRHRNRDHAGPLLLLPNRRPLHAGVLRCQPTRPRRPGRSHVGTGGAAMAHPLLMCWVEFFFFLQCCLLGQRLLTPSLPPPLPIPQCLPGQSNFINNL